MHEMKRLFAHVVLVLGISREEPLARVNRAVQANP
jgi:hypothetical protein